METPPNIWGIWLGGLGVGVFAGILLTATLVSTSGMCQ